MIFRLVPNLQKNKSKYLIVFALFLISACSSQKPIESGTAEEVFNRGLEEFKDEDYLDAQKYFDIIKLQYPASAYSDDAQFYLAEINFKRHEYILAAFNYSSLRRIYPQSEYVKEALYKTAMSFYELSPPFDRDQEYTFKAIQSLSEYMALYQSDTLYSKAQDLIMELRNKLAEGNLFIAGLYRNMRSIHSSIVYYDAVIEDYPDTKFYERAFAEKIDVLIEMGKPEQALGTITLYKKLFPNGEYKSRIETAEKGIEK